MSIVVQDQSESVQQAAELDLVCILAPDESTPQDIIAQASSPNHCYFQNVYDQKPNNCEKGR